jgi:DNA-directed RNA polymerase specialized sigma24 family protein
MAADSAPDITALLAAWGRGDLDARERLMLVVYEELRFFGGLSLQETAHVLHISVATVEREWQAGRAWLYSRLKSRRDEA